MVKKVTSLCLAAAGMLSVLAAFLMWSAPQARAVVLNNSLCYQGDCRGFNWANSIPYDANGNPLPQGTICTILLNQNVQICGSTPGPTCNSPLGYIPTCRGRYIDPITMQVFDCWYYAYNC